MKKQVKNSTKKTRVETYTPVEKNIYKVNNRYRVRVGSVSANTSSLKEARRIKKILRSNMENNSRIW